MQALEGFGSGKTSPTASAPDWFAHAMAIEPERSRFAHEGAQIELLTWGEASERPGLLFVHGNGAHADWWRWIAPFFAADRRVAALSLSGMGGSDHRENYSVDGYGREILGALDAAQLLGSAKAPYLVAHSFGGAPAVTCAAANPAAIGGVIFVDSFFRNRRKPSASPRTSMPTYPTLADAVARFRLAPPQPCDFPVILDFIARASLKPVVRADDSEQWTWRFDPTIWDKLKVDDLESAVAAVRQPIAMIWGELSALSDADEQATARRLAPHALHVRIPNAYHHIMIDQPLALVTAIRAILAAWEQGKSAYVR